MKDLKSWLENGPKKENANNNIAGPEEAIKHFSSKSEDELLRDLRASFESGKADGSITPESIKNFTETVSPMLSPEQKKKLAALMKSLS